MSNFILSTPTKSSQGGAPLATTNGPNRPGEGCYGSLFASSTIAPRPTMMVTPECPKRSSELARLNLAAISSAEQVAARIVPPSPRELFPNLLTNSSQPTLLPRPDKAGGHSFGAPPSIPLIHPDVAPNKYVATTFSCFPAPTTSQPPATTPGLRLNKFVRRLHDMLQAEKDSGIVEWRRGLLVLYSTDAFAKQILPKYFNTKNFKTFRRQLNYYGFVHVRSFSTTGSSTTALWVNRSLAKEPTDDIASVLKLRRVEPCESAKTAEGRRHRKELAICTVEEDIGVSAKTLQLEQIRSLALRGAAAAAVDDDGGRDEEMIHFTLSPTTRTATSTTLNKHPIPQEVHIPTDVSSHSFSTEEQSSMDDNSEHSSSGPPPQQQQQQVPDCPMQDLASESAAIVLLMLAKSH